MAAPRIQPGRAARLGGASTTVAARPFPAQPSRCPSVCLPGVTEVTGGKLPRVRRGDTARTCVRATWDRCTHQRPFIWPQHPHPGVPRGSQLSPPIFPVAARKSVHASTIPTCVLDKIKLCIYTSQHHLQCPSHILESPMKYGKPPAPSTPAKRPKPAGKNQGKGKKAK